MMDILIVGSVDRERCSQAECLGIWRYLGYDVKLSERCGMAQRGGNVVTHVRFGEKVYAPVIDDGCADIILALEMLEA